MQPLLEVFGHPVSDQSSEARRHRESCLCPFGNIVPNCTKDKVTNPLGVCSIRGEYGNAIICPVRFRQKGIVAENAAKFFFGSGARWAVVPEVRLKDKYGRAAGNIDMVVVAYDSEGRIADFGALEVQAVYISGNIRNPFDFYIANSHLGDGFDWNKQSLYPRPDYLSSSRKRLAPQLLYKGSILRTWGKRLTVALDSGFMQTLPELTMVEACNADIAWHVYDLVNTGEAQLQLALQTELCTQFEDSMRELTITDAGPVDDFIAQLQRKLDTQLKPLSRRGRTIE